MELLRHLFRVGGVRDDARLDEDDDLGAVHRRVVAGQYIVQKLDRAETGDARAIVAAGIADEPGQHDGLPVGDRDRTANPSLRDRRCQRRRVGRRDGADLLLDVERHDPVGIHLGQDVQDDARVLVIDVVDHGRETVVGRLRGAGQDRNLVADLQDGRLAIEDDKRGRGQDLHRRVALQGTEQDAGVRQTAREKVEARRIQARDLEVGGTTQTQGAIALKEELHTVLQLIGQRHLGDGRFDVDLHGLSVHLADRTLDELVVARIGIDQQRVAGGIRRHPDLGRTDAAMQSVAIASTLARSTARRHGGLENAEGRLRAGRVGSCLRRRRVARLPCIQPSVGGTSGTGGAASRCRGCEATRLQGVLVRPARGGPAARAEKVVQRRRHGLGLGVLQLVDLDARGSDVGPVEPRHPFPYEIDALGRPCNGQDGVEAAHRLELDGALGHAALATVHDVIDLADHRLGRRIGER